MNSDQAAPSCATSEKRQEGADVGGSRNNSEQTSDKAIWILGATGRIGRAVAARLVADGQSVTLVGRNVTQLHRVGAPLKGRVTIKVLAAVAEMARAITQERPAIVLNMVGPFVDTALVIARACPPGTHYVDLSNELPSVQALLGLHAYASRSGSTFVTGAGFGVLATESVVLTLCEGHPAADRVRCAAIPAAATEPGPLGVAFASSITAGLARGGKRYEDGQLVRTALMGDFERIRLPDRRAVGTGSAPSGELEAAQRASGALYAVSTTSMVPSAAFLRATVPILLKVMKIPFVRRFSTRRIAAIEVKAATSTTPQISWSHARVEWSSGVMRQGWMRTGDAMVFTADVMARVAIRLINGDGVPGAYTPGALFGPGLAIECSAEMIPDSDQGRVMNYS